MDEKTRALVRSRAGNRCEYCRLPQHATPFISFHIEHILAKQHTDADQDDPQNLALACDRCNAYKGTNLSSVDPVTGLVVGIFHPRRDAWDEHFVLVTGRIEGLSPAGRATARLLNMNASRRVELREQVGKADRLD